MLLCPLSPLHPERTPTPTLPHPPQPCRSATSSCVTTGLRGHVSESSRSGRCARESGEEGAYMSTSSRLSRCPNAVLQMGVPRTAPFTLLSAPLPPNMCPHQVPEGGRCAYRVTVYTADERGAGTGADRGVGRANHFSHSFLIPPIIIFVCFRRQRDDGPVRGEGRHWRAQAGHQCGERGWGGDGHRRKPGW